MLYDQEKVRENAEKLFVGGPWYCFTEKADHATPFHNYWMQVWKGERETEPFVYFGNPVQGVHEIAHLVCASDSQILSPTWGLSMTDPYLELSERERISEMLVFYVETMLLSDIEEWRDNRYARVSTQVLHTTYSFAQAYKLSLSQRKTVMRYARTMFPTVESIHQELQRKYTLLTKLL